MRRPTRRGTRSRRMADTDIRGGRNGWGNFAGNVLGYKGVGVRKSVRKEGERGVEDGICETRKHGRKRARWYLLYCHFRICKTDISRCSLDELLKLRNRKTSKYTCDPRHSTLR